MDIWIPPIVSWQLWMHSPATDLFVILVLMKRIAPALLLCLCCIAAVAQTGPKKRKVRGPSDEGKPRASLNHIAIYVKDLAKSTEFYRVVVQLDTIPEPFHDGRHTWFRVGPKAALHVISGADSVSWHNKNAHLCFSVASVNNYLTRLRDAGIAYEDWAGKTASVTTRTDGVKQIWFRDPDGYWIEINDAKD